MQEQNSTILDFEIENISPLQLHEPIEYNKLQIFLKEILKILENDGG